MTTAEILEALEALEALNALEAFEALPPSERCALGHALLRDEDLVSPEDTGRSPIGTSRAWPVFTSPLAGKGSAATFDQPAIREPRIDEHVGRALHESP